MTQIKTMTAEAFQTDEAFQKTYFPEDDCIFCGKHVPCYTDPETSLPLCLDCLETECENVALGLGHYTDPLPEVTLPTPDAGNGHSDRTNPALRTVGSR